MSMEIIVREVYNLVRNLFAFRLKQVRVLE
jgi:hypothetical protein